MHSLIYISVAPKVVAEETLFEILEQSRISNKARDITGCLAYIEGTIKGEYHCRFIQILEGPESEVISLFDKIKQDSRHTDVSLIKAGVIEKRNFGSWEMGFEKINLSSNSSLKGFFNLDPEILASEGDINNNMLLDFMKSFYTHL